MNTGSITYSNYVTNWSNARKLLNDTGSKGKQVVNHLYAGTSTKMPVNKNLFRGDVVLLTSGKTTSAASEFAAIAHHLKRAKIVGEETGGCYYGATGGNFLLLTLPATRLEVRIPTIRIFTAVDEDLVHQPAGRGTFPDHYVVPAINNFLKGEDVQLKFALNLFNSQTKPRTAFN
jgi:C-terminal processing protease CtpA/Prc